MTRRPAGVRVDADAPSAEHAMQPTGTPSPTPARPRPPADGARATSALAPLDAASWTPREARHLLWRAGFGGTAEQIAILTQWGAQKAVDHLVELDEAPAYPVDVARFSKDIMRPATAEERMAYRNAQRARDEDTLARLRLMRQEAQGEDRRQMREIQRWWLARMIQTPRPLEEKLTLFWHGHFATSYRTIEDSWHMLVQNQLFRSEAAGNFGKLLYAIIRDPAMLAYLDQNDSRKNRPNENLARELMELFSLGAGNYSEDDIKQGARALTGYTFEDDAFVFRPENHDNGVKSILGSRGTFDGEDFVGAILARDACSTFIARKLYAFFAAELPADEKDIDPETRAVIKEMATVLRRGRYELKPVLKQLFLSRHFYSERLINQQIKSPAVLIAGAVRSLNTPVRDMSILIDAMDLMGQNLFYPPSVKGWDGGRSWVNTSTLFVRQNILAYLLTGKKPQGYDAMADQDVFASMDVLKAAAGGTAPSDPGAAADALVTYCLGSSSDRTRGPVVEYLASQNNTINDLTVAGCLMLITAMPDYQLC